MTDDEEREYANAQMPSQVEQVLQAILDTTPANGGYVRIGKLVTTLQKRFRTPAADTSTAGDWTASVSGSLHSLLAPDGEEMLCGVRNEYVCERIADKINASLAALREQLTQAERQIEMDTECIERIRTHGMKMEITAKEVATLREQLAQLRKNPDPLSHEPGR